VSIGRDEYVGWIGPDGHVICYPIRGGSLYNIFAGMSRTTGSRSHGRCRAASMSCLRATALERALLEMLAHVEHCYKWGIRDRDPLEHWTSGRVTLLGDAAHPMMPTLGARRRHHARGRLRALRGIWRGMAIRRTDSRLRGRARPRASQVQLQAREQFRNNRMAPHRRRCRATGYLPRRDVESVATPAAPVT